MQEMTATICNNMDLYSSLKLRDDRGAVPQFYRVRKMPDGKCWMIDNLKLELSTGMQLTSDTSNVPSGSPITVTLGGSGTYTGNFITSGSMGYDYWAQANPSDPSRAGTESCVAGNFVDPASTTGCGYLYNWYTATASSGTQAAESDYVTSSICPAGWRLPRGNDGTLAQNEFAVLNSAMYNGSLEGIGNSNDTSYARNWQFTGLFAGSLSGYYHNTFGNQGWHGQFWSSSALTNSNAWHLAFWYNLISPGFGWSGKYNGFAIRCII
jgi:uncharacterized protein (TIGR02145 family)